MRIVDTFKENSFWHDKKLMNEVLAVSSTDGEVCEIHYRAWYVCFRAHLDIDLMYV